MFQYYHYLCMTRKHCKLSCDIFESSMIISYNPNFNMNRYMNTSVNASVHGNEFGNLNINMNDMNNMNSRSMNMNMHNHFNTAIMRQRILPYYDVHRLLLYPTDIYYMFYQSNLFRWDELEELRTSGMQTIQDVIKTIGTTITQGIYDFLFPNGDDYRHAQIALQNGVNGVNSVNEAIIRQDICCKIIIVPPTVLFDENSIFFQKYRLDIVPLFNDMKNWKMLFLYQGTLLAYLPYQEFTDNSNSATALKIQKYKTYPIASIKRLHDAANKHKTLLENNNIDFATDVKDDNDNNNNGNDNNDKKNEDDDDDDSYWFESTRKWHPINTYFELSSYKTKQW